MVLIGVIGDYDPLNDNHIATTVGVEHAANRLGEDVRTIWVATDHVHRVPVARFHGLLIAPGSPYRSLAGALRVIERARAGGVPLLGTCGGFQHVVLEYARNVAGFPDAQHAEYDPYASDLFITPLSCSLAGQTMTVQVSPDTIAARAYGCETVTERYYCNFGLNPEHLDTIVAAGLAVSGTDQDGEARILELPGHPFFMATLFVPQASSTRTVPHPLLLAFVEAAKH